MSKYLARLNAKNQKTCLPHQVPKVTEGVFVPIGTDGDGDVARIEDAFGTNSISFIDQALGRLAAIMRRKGAVHPTEVELNAALAAVDGIQPTDETEAMLARANGRDARNRDGNAVRAKQAEMMPTLQECGSLAVKLLRTYTAQVEALVRLRRGGEQRVIVQHVNVNDGGQAIVGAVNQPGGSEK